MARVRAPRLHGDGGWIGVDRDITACRLRRTQRAYDLVLT